MNILLHTCCGPCASASVERLLNDNHTVTLFYSNSNISPYKEFLLRAEHAKKLADHFNVPLIIDEYDHYSWLEFIAGFENEPEKGARCAFCFEFSMARTQKVCEELNIQHFSTTLTVSPHKNSKILKQCGDNFASYFHVDFKKKDGFKRRRWI